MPTRLACEVSLEWLVAEHLRLVNERFTSHIVQIQAVEQGVLRALAAAFGESVPDLPDSFDEVEGAEQEEIPDWWRAYAEANKDRNIVI